MGSVANSEERAMRIKAHEEVDKLWKGGLLPRREVYRELSEVLNIPRPYTHIAMLEMNNFDLVNTWAKARLEQLKSKK